MKEKTTYNVTLPFFFVKNQSKEGKLFSKFVLL